MSISVNTKNNIVVVNPKPIQTVVVSPSGRGPRGPAGASPIVSKYRQENISINNGTLEVDASVATTFYTVIDQNVSSIIFRNWPESGQSQRIALYIQQDAVGFRILEGWPETTLSPDGEKPLLSVAPNSIDCIVVDSFDGGNTFFATLVGTNYS